MSYIYIFNAVKKKCEIIAKQQSLAAYFIRHDERFPRAQSVPNRGQIEGPKLEGHSAPIEDYQLRMHHLIIQHLAKVNFIG